MKRYRDFISDQILSDLEDTQSSESDCRSNLQAEGLALKPETARIFAFALISRVMSHRNDVHNATGAEAKIDKMSDLVTDIAYIALLQIAMYQNDSRLLRKIPRR